MTNKNWTLGKGIAVGMSAIAIAIVLSFLIVAMQSEIGKYQYSNCLENKYDSDICMPLINKNYYPERYKPFPPPERIEPKEVVQNKT